MLGRCFYLAGIFLCDVCHALCLFLLGRVSCVENKALFFSALFMILFGRICVGFLPLISRMSLHYDHSYARSTYGEKLYAKTRVEKFDVKSLTFVFTFPLFEPQPL